MHRHVAQLIACAEIVVVTTPQTAAAEVAERAGTIAVQTRQRVAGVVENTSWLCLPAGSTLEIFGSGGGTAITKSLSPAVGAEVPLLGRMHLDPRLREVSQRVKRGPRAAIKMRGLEVG